MVFSTETIFILQLVGVIVAGSFIGEFYRTFNTPSLDTSLAVFISRFLAGGFLTFLASYFLYNIVSHKQVTLLFAGILSYQKEQYVIDITKQILQRILNDSNNRKGEKR